MARRKSLNRLRNLKRSRSIDSGRLDPDTDIMGEEQTLWWNNLAENTFTSIHNENETAKQLSDNSEMDSQDRSRWYNNLESSDSEYAASASSRRNFSTAIVKPSVLHTSTSESEKELELKKRKVRLRVPSRKSTGNAFLNAVADAEVAIPLKLQQKQANRSDLHSDSDGEVSRRRLQEDEEDSSISTNILKPKPSISRRRRDGSTKDQNAFQDVLTEDGGLDEEGDNISVGKSNVSSSSFLENDESRGKSSVFLKPKPKILKSIRNKSPTKNPFEEILEGSDDTNARKSTESTKDNHASFERHEVSTRISQAHGSSPTEKSPQLRRTKSTTIVKASVLHTSTSESEKEPDLKKRKVRLRATSRKSTGNAFSNAVDDAEIAIPLKLQQKQANRSDLHSDSDGEVSRRRLQEDEEDSSISTNIVKPKPSISRRRRDGSTKDQNAFQDVLTEDGGLDGSATKKSVALESLRNKRLTKNTFEEVCEEDDNISVGKNMSSSSFLENDESRGKRSIFLTPKSKSLRNKSPTKNPFEEILEGGDDTNARKSTESTKDNHASFERHEVSTRISQAHGSSPTEKSAQSRRTRSMTIVKASVLHTSTSESEKEPDLKKRKVRLRATSRKSTGNAFSNAVDDAEVAIPLKLQQKQANRSDLHSDSDGEVSRRRLQEDEEDSSISTNIVKPKPSISRRRRDGSTKDQNAFQDVLTEDGGLDGSATKKSVALESLRNKRLTKNTFEEVCEEDDNISVGKNVSSSSFLENDESRGKRSVFLTPKSKSLRNKSPTKNPFEEILEGGDDTNARKSTESTKDNHASFERHEVSTRISQVHGSSPTEKSAQSRRTRSTTIVKASVLHTSTSESEKEPDLKKRKVRLRATSRKSTGNAFSNAVDDAEVAIPLKLQQKQANRSDLHSDSDREVSRRRLQEDEEDSLRNKRLTKNPFEEIIEEGDNISAGKSNVLSNSSLDNDESRGKRSVFLKPKSKSLRNKSPTKNPFEEIFEEDDDTDARKSNESTKNNHASFERHEVSTRISQAHGSSTTEERAQSGRTRSTSKEDFDDIFLVLSDERSVSKKSNASSENRDVANISKSISQKSVVTETPEKQISFSRKSAREETSKEHIPAKPGNKDVELSRRSGNWIVNIEEVDNINADSEMNIDISRIISSTRISTASKVNANMGMHKSAVVPAVEMETADNEDADPAMQALQRNFTSTKAETNNKAVNRQSSNRTSIKEDRETARRQKSLNKSQNYHSTPIRASSKIISSDISKLNSSKTFIQDRKINDFFKVKQSSINKQSSDREQNLTSQVLHSEKMEKIKTELERIKIREMAAMKIGVTTDKKESAKAKDVKSLIMLKQATKKKLPAKPTKVVDKAFLIDGKVYKPPRLPRPKHWVTDRLYKFLWKCMEPKYKLATRVKSEKFVQEFAKIVTFIERRKKYESYKTELEALMKEMARLKIISTRNDFYHFCQDFLPYEFRVKVVPMLLPGNKNNIPYNPENLHIPLLE